MLRILLCLWCVTLFGSHAIAQTPRLITSYIFDHPHSPIPPQTPNNAALVYIKAWDTITSREDRSAFGMAIWNTGSRGTKLTPEQRSQLKKHRAYIDLVLAAAAMPHCDFGPRYELGFEMYQGYLGELRQSCRALALDATRCAEEGNAHAAGERIAAMFRLSAHAAADRTLIAHRVGVAIGSLAASTAQDMIAQGQMTVPASRVTLTALHAITAARELYHVREALKSTRDLTCTWLRAQCVGPNAGVAYFRSIPGSFNLNPTEWPPKHFLLPLGEQQMAAQFDRASALFDAIDAAWGEPNSVIRLDELLSEADECQWGLIGETFLLSTVYARRVLNAAVRDFAHLDANLTAIIQSNDPATPVPYPP